MVNAVGKDPGISKQDIKWTFSEDQGWSEKRWNVTMDCLTTL